MNFRSLSITSPPLYYHFFGDIYIAFDYLL